MTVSRVHDEHVHLRVDERGRALQRVRADADRRADAQSTLLVLRRIRVLDPLRDVLDRDEPREASFVIDDRQLLDLVAVEDRLGLLERRADRSGDEIPARHQRGDGLRGVRLEAEVAVREDADEDAVVVDDRNAGDPIALHELERVGDEIGRPKRHGLDDHPRLRALHLVHLGDLIGDREIAVDDSEPTFARQRDREARLGDGVHRRRDQRDVQRDGRCETRDGRDVVREDVRLGRKQQHVVEREPFLAELPLERDEALDLLLAELGLHQTTLAAPGDGDQATSMPSPSSRSRSARGAGDVALRVADLDRPRPRGRLLVPSSRASAASRRAQPRSARTKKKSVVSARRPPVATRRLGLLGRPCVSQQAPSIPSSVHEVDEVLRQARAHGRRRTGRSASSKRPCS